MGNCSGSKYKSAETEKWELHEVWSALDVGRCEQASSLPPGTDLAHDNRVGHTSPQCGAQTKALNAELPRAGIEANGPTIAMNAGEFEGVQPDHHGL